MTVLFKGMQFNPKQIESALIGKPALPFRASWIQGQEHLPTQEPGHFSLEDLKGKNVVLNFWASWCVSCKAEAKDLEAYWQSVKGSDTVVIGVAIQDTQEAALGFAMQYGKKYILGLDSEETAAIEYGVTGVPETFLINKEGTIVHKEAGPVTVKMLQELAQKF